MISTALDLSEWFEQQLKTNGLHSELSDAPLEEPWQVIPDSPKPISRIDSRFFSAVHVEVTLAEKREVQAWKQPLLQEADPKLFLGKEITGVILLVRKQVKLGQDLFLVQAKAEPGNSDRRSCLLLAPTIQASFSNALAHPGKVPLWTELDIDGFTRSEMTDTNNAPKLACLGKDGGRFYRKNNLLALYDISEEYPLVIPETHTWATRESIRELQLSGLGNEHLAEVFGTFL